MARGLTLRVPPNAAVAVVLLENRRVVDVALVVPRCGRALDGAARRARERPSACERGAYGLTPSERSRKKRGPAGPPCKEEIPVVPEGRTPGAGFQSPVQSLKSPPAGLAPRVEVAGPPVRLPGRSEEEPGGGGRIENAGTRGPWSGIREGGAVATRAPAGSPEPGEREPELVQSFTSRA